MRWDRSRSVGSAPARSGWFVVTVCALALGGCNTNGQPAANAALPRGATVAFESIDGLPPPIFRKLVQTMNAEAQARRLAVASRKDRAVYRVRGYLATRIERGKTAKTLVTWIWDVYDTEQTRVVRISGEEIARGRHRDAWTVADDAMLGRIARSSMEQLAAFLTSPDAASSAAPEGGFPVDSTPAVGPTLALAAAPDPAPADR